MNIIDEPLFDAEFSHQEKKAGHASRLEPRIRELVAKESFCVLCTQGRNQPYGSLIAYAFTDDLKHFFFCTQVATRKFKLLSSCHRVALLIDTRCRHSDDINAVEAITVTGKARRLNSGDEHEDGVHRLKKRHPYLAEFLRAESTAVFRVDVVRYFHVTRFQEVSQWIP